MIERELMKKIYITLLVVMMLGVSLASAQERSNRFQKWRDNNGSQFKAERQQNNKAYKYQENDGIVTFYETKDRDLYRKLLPKEFDMPENLLVHLFVMDFYKIDSDAEPYKEVSISLLAKHNGGDVWHCIYMPVTSRHSMLAGQRGLGLPKTMGEIAFSRNDSVFIGEIIDNQGRAATFMLDTNNYIMSKNEEEQIKKLNAIPKVSILRGKPIQMTRSGGQGNIIDVSKRYPNLLKVLGGKSTISFDDASNDHPFDLKPSSVIASYYIHNKIPFRLGRK